MLFNIVLILGFSIFGNVIMGIHSDSIGESRTNILDSLEAKILLGQLRFVIPIVLQIFAIFKIKHTKKCDKNILKKGNNRLEE